MDCLNLLGNAEKPGTIIDAPYLWKRYQFEELFPA
jgi:hypothetical protein